MRVRACPTVTHARAHCRSDSFADSDSRASHARANIIAFADSHASPADAYHDAPADAVADSPTDPDATYARAGDWRRDGYGVMRVLP